MARRKKGQDFGNLFKNLFSSKLVLIGLLCIVVTGGFFYGIWYFLHNDPFFTINSVSVNEEGDYSLWKGKDRLGRLYAGRNIFSVNPAEIEIMIRDEAPQLDTVTVRRIMPDRLEIDVVPRRPVAFIDAGEPVIIDAEAIVLSREGSTGDLVQIKGIRFFFSSPSVGERIDNAMLSKALALLDALREKGISGKIPVKFIDISDRNDIQFSILDVRIKMGNSGFPGKIIKLKEILDDPDVDIKDIKYIDLRFEKAVISPK
ncbi:MAG: FtsQ-type POTRA domain-containing protein [Candidatus Omnitrophota bacterium]